MAGSGSKAVPLPFHHATLPSLSYTYLPAPLTILEELSSFSPPHTHTHIPPSLPFLSSSLLSPGEDAIRVAEATRHLLITHLSLSPTQLLSHPHLSLCLYLFFSPGEDAIRVAEATRHPDAEGLKQRHYKWLLETGQEETAGNVKEREGDFLGAISL